MGLELEQELLGELQGEVLAPRVLLLHLGKEVSNLQIFLCQKQKPNQSSKAHYVPPFLANYPPCLNWLVEEVFLNPDCELEPDL